MTDVIKPLQKLIEVSRRHAWELWERTKNDDDEKRIHQRKNFLRIYTDKIYAEASDLLNYCMPLIDENKNMMFEDFFNELGNMTIANEPSREQDTQWTKCAKLFIANYRQLKFYEENERKGLCKYIYSGDYVYREFTNGKGELIDYVESFPLRENKVLCEYSENRGTFEYELCSKVAEYINICIGMDDLSSKMYGLYVLTVCFYIAIKNETEYLLEDEVICDLDAHKLDSQTGDAPQGKRTESVTIPHELDTPEGRALLQKVINAGFCDENYNWDETKWPDGDDLYGLVYFVEKANRVLKLQKEQKNGRFYSWKPFDTLFTYRGKMARKDDKTQLQIIRKNLVRYQSNKKRFDPKQSVKDKIDPLFS